MFRLFNRRERKNRHLPTLNSRVVYLPSTNNGDGDQSERAAEAGRRKRLSSDANATHRDGSPDDATVVAEWAERIGQHLFPLLSRDHKEKADDLAEALRQIQTAADNRIRCLIEKFSADIARAADEQRRHLDRQLGRCIKPIARHIANVIAQDAKSNWEAIRKDISDSVIGAAQHAAQRPIVKRLITFLDRVRDEREFLAASFLRDPHLSLHVGARQLQERYDSAVGSLDAEIQMILRGLGVEQIQTGAGRFDPQTQHVKGIESTTRPELDGHIAKKIRAGFVWNGTRIRPEDVIVYKVMKKGA